MQLLQAVDICCVSWLHTRAFCWKSEETSHTIGSKNLNCQYLAGSTHGAKIHIWAERLNFETVPVPKIRFIGKFLPSGEAVWEVMYDDKIYYTRFA